MPRGYLDEMIPVNSGIVGQYISPVGPFREPMYAMVDNDTVPISTRSRSSKSKKKKSNKPKNDGIIRNHDSVWDYKIQDGKLLTRRKSSDGKWYDITSNDEARSKIESFTGSSIGGSLNKQTNNKQSTNVQATAATTTQPSRQQTVARQDSTRRNVTNVQQPVQQRSLSETPANNAEPDWQNMTDAEVQAYFSNSPLGGVTKVGRGNSNKKTQLLSDEDLAANGWSWASNWNDKATFDNGYGLNLGLSAVEKTKAGDKILVDSNGAIVPTSEVNRYINRGRVPLSISDYDLQFYQPQSENGTLRDVRRAQDIRRNRAFDRERNGYLAAAFGLPALIASGVTAPLATIGAVAGSTGMSTIMDGIAEMNGRKSWRETIGGNDPTAQFYADFISPFNIVGGVLGGAAGNTLQPVANRVVSPIVNSVRGYLTNRFGAIPGASRTLYPTLGATTESEGSIALAKAMEEALNPTTPRVRRGGVRSRQLAKVMNKSLTDPALVQREQQMLATDVPYLFDPAMTSSGNYLPLNPAMSAEYLGPYGIPNHVNGVPFGVPVPRVLGAVPESGTTLVLPVRPNSSLQPMPDAFGYYGAPYRRQVQVVQAEQPRVVVKGSTKKQYPKRKGNKKKK